MRCFVGIELDGETRDRLASVGEQVRRAGPSIAGEKWVRPENLHVTVAFLGDVAKDVVEVLADELGQALAETDSFTLPFSGLRAVPNVRRATMLWAAYDDPDGCGERLARTFAAACEPFGITIEDRPFKAHVTLARMRRPREVPAEAVAALETLDEAVPAILSVPSATLLASTLTRSGPIYRTVAVWDFRPSETSH
jgi:RNA 2',3'-cyclic 3'-phosphodiesterase